MARGERQIKVKIDGDETGLGVAANKAKRDVSEVDRQVAKYSETVRRLERDIRRTGDTSLFRDLNKNRRVLKQFESLGSEAASGFGAQFIGKAGPLIARLPVSPQVLAAGAAIGAALSPAIAATVSAAILGGVGIGGVLGGVALVKDDPRVVASFTALSNEAGGILSSAAEPMVPAIVDAVDKARAEIRKLAPEFENIFQISSSLVDPLVVGALAGIESTVKGIESAMRGARPVVVALGQAFEMTGDTIGKSLELLSDNGPEAADAIRNLATIINVTLGSTITTINALTEAYGWLRRGIAFFQGDTRTMAEYTVAHAESKRAIEGTSEAARDNANAITNNSIAMQRYKLEAEGATVATKGQAQALSDLYDAARSVYEQNLSLAESELSYRQAVNDTKDAVDGKRKVSDAEQQSLLGLARSTNELTNSMEKSGATTQQLTKHSNESRASFIALAERMGYTKQQAKELADRFLAVPKTVQTNVSAPGLTKAKNDAAAFLSYANDLNGMRIRVSTETSGFVGPTGAAAFKRHGGVTQHAADGLIRDAGIFSAVPRGARYGFAEPETGGEAFIPKRSSNMARSLAIWEFVGREWLNALPRGGAQAPTVPSASPAAGGDVSVNVSLDGKPFYAYTTTASRREIERANWKARKRDA